jgi:DNA-binding PadR family transcriptional regulator
MSRNLRLMQRNGWIELASTDDGRERCYRLTPRGEKVFSAAKPGWMRAQAKLRAALRTGEWEALLKASSRVAEAAIVARRDFPAK